MSLFSPPFSAPSGAERASAPLEAPEGTRDWLFEEARVLRSCERAIGAAFEAAGFSEVIPPTLERAELFTDVAALRASDASGQALAIRSDFTAQIARIAAGRLRSESPLKLWYRGAVVRDAVPGRITPRERFQTGLELVGEPSVEADVEVLAIAGAALEAVGLGAANVRISVGSTAYFGALLAACGADATLSARLRDAVDRKNRAEALRLLDDVNDGPAREALAFLASPEAQGEVLDVARRLAPDDAAREAIERLALVVDGARKRGLGELLEVDLGEVRGVGYYTGLVFNVYVDGAPGPVGGGGRYDTLLSRFGDPRPAVGFSLDVDALVPLVGPEFSSC